MCKAGGKEFNNWYQLIGTKELISTLEDEIFNPGFQGSENNKVEITTSKLVDIKKGGNFKLQGSWIHPDLAVQLAQWISPLFAIKVSRFIREYAITGGVSGNVKTNSELLQLQQELKKLQDTHHKMLQKKHYHKFKKGPAFYIISDLDGKSKKYKPGFEGVDISVRLAQHRSTTPGIRLEYLIYTNDAKLIETNVLKKYESKRLVTNHEWLFDIDVIHIIKSTRTILDVLNIEYTEEENIKNYNEQIDVDCEIENDE